jgi:hypothetical protein
VTHPDTPPSFITRLWLAWVSFFGVLFDAAFAARVLAARSSPALPAKPSAAPPANGEPAKLVSAPMEQRIEEGALQLLAVLQREGRLVDFLEQDITTFSDADVGAAARVVHEGCRKALRTHVTLAPVRGEDEGAMVTLPSGFRAAEVKLTGAVGGSGPYKGVLRHRGWKATDVMLPRAMVGHDAKVIAAAEVEL